MNNANQPTNTQPNLYFFISGNMVYAEFAESLDNLKQANKERWLHVLGMVPKCSPKRYLQINQQIPCSESDRRLGLSGVWEGKADALAWIVKNTKKAK